MYATNVSENTICGMTSGQNLQKWNLYHIIAENITTTTLEQLLVPTSEISSVWAWVSEWEREIHSFHFFHYNFLFRTPFLVMCTKLFKIYNYSMNRNWKRADPKGKMFISKVLKGTKRDSLGVILFFNIIFKVIAHGTGETI